MALTLLLLSYHYLSNFFTWLPDLGCSAAPSHFFMMFLIHFFSSYNREKFLKILDIFLQTKDSGNAKSISIAEWQEIFGIITADARQPWTDSCDFYSDYLIIYFDHLIIFFDYLIIG